MRVRIRFATGTGSGKTFLVLDWALRMAAGADNWLGHRVCPASVVYLAGEGHHGLRGRIAAWKQHAKPPRPLDMWISKAGCDLNTPTGYQRVTESIRLLPASPDLIVVDTLHRFLAGDENSAEDAKGMLDACAGLMAEFGCSVLLVHYTGVADEAQHRARGSSAWRGALDQAALYSASVEAARSLPNFRCAALPLGFVASANEPSDFALFRHHVASQG